MCWWQPERDSYWLSEIREARKSCVKLEICSETVMKPTLFDCLKLAVQKWMAMETFSAGERIYFKFNNIKKTLQEVLFSMAAVIQESVSKIF